MIFRKYPAYLSVTLGSYQPETTTGSVSLTRPMSVLEEETTGDIYTCASDADEPIDDQSHQVASGLSIENRSQQNHPNALNRIETKVLKIKPRLPGQVSAHKHIFNLPSLKFSNTLLFIRSLFFF